MPDVAPPACTDGVPLLQSRIDAVCADRPYAVAGVLTPLAFVLNTSHCGGEIPYEIHIDDERRAIELTTYYCPSADDCELPPPLINPIPLPPLMAGVWRVEVNGSSGFDLPVVEPEPFVFDVVPTCWTLAEEPRVEEASCDWPGASVGDSACFPSEVYFPAWGAVTVRDECGCGNPSGPCEVRVGAGRIEVQAAFRDCGSRCRDTCAATERACWLPYGVPIGTYEVVVDGIRDSATHTVLEVPASLEELGPPACVGDAP